MKSLTLLFSLLGSPLLCGADITDTPGSINVYFNKFALWAYASSTDNRANGRVNLEDRLIARLASARSIIDIAVYEINLPRIVGTLIARAAAGVRVRMIADAKAPTDAGRIARYTTMRLNLEQLKRGSDGTIGTDDDVVIFSDSPIFAVEDATARTSMGLPANPTDIPQVTVQVGNSNITGRMIADAEIRPNNRYYSPGQQMHNKFAVIDRTWVWTGSWNWTVTGLYGSEANRMNGLLHGNSQHAVELNSPALAVIYINEFEEMWGTAKDLPNPTNANYHGRKTDNTLHTVNVGNRQVDVYFSPGDDAVGHVTSYVTNHADFSAYFTIFAWSDQGLVDALKLKWENDPDDREGTLTGFEVRGVFDRSFWNQWWSASIDMTGRTGSRDSTNNLNTRWANPAPVFRDGEVRKLHSKTMIIDACTNSDPTVIVGSTNWSNNGNNINDENLLMIHDPRIANQFLQEFYSRYRDAGGTVPTATGFTCAGIN